jgi:uncharacterized protein (TIGR02646 family)
MISLSTPAPRDCLTAFSRQSPPPEFDCLAFQTCKQKTRKDLLGNQQHQCAFCESPIKDDGNSTHLDHLMPQDLDASRRFDIHNLVACCQDNKTCGHKHKSHPVPDELNPYLARNLHRSMLCHSTGELYNATDAHALSAQAWKFAQVHLNLNSPELQMTRKVVMSQIQKQTIALGTNARKRIKNLSTKDVGFLSLHQQLLGRFGFTLPI